MTTALKTLISEAKKAVKPSERFILLDNGGKTADRYSLFDTKPTGYEGDDPSRYVHQYVGFDENPSSPQGFGQHGDITQAQFAAHKKEKFRSLGKKIKLDDLDDKARAFADDFIRDALTEAITEVKKAAKGSDDYTAEIAEGIVKKAVALAEQYTVPRPVKASRLELSRLGEFAELIANHIRPDVAAWVRSSKSK